MAFLDAQQEPLRRDRPQGRIIALVPSLDLGLGQRRAPGGDRRAWARYRIRPITMSDTIVRPVTMAVVPMT